MPSRSTTHQHGLGPDREVGPQQDIGPARDAERIKPATGQSATGQSADLPEVAGSDEPAASDMDEPALRLDHLSLSAAVPHERLLRPEPTVDPVRVRWRYAIGIPLLHLLACLALVPWLFTWAGVIAAVAGLYVFGTLGINLGYHRLLTHRGFTVPRWLEHGLAILGVCTLQDTPACWVAMHRLHHQHSDERPDPHSPWVSFLWGHCGWLMFTNRDFLNLNYYQRYTRDLLRDPFYMKLERSGGWLRVYLASVLVFWLLGMVLGWALQGTLQEAVRYGASLVVWGVFLRTVMTWHITWSVNSVTHLWGYRNYATSDSSRNNVLVGLWSNGEGWHNNHHADQRAAAHGHRWWELDVSWMSIWLLEKLGLARDVVRPRAWRGK